MGAVPLRSPAGALPALPLLQLGLQGAQGRGLFHHLVGHLGAVKGQALGLFVELQPGSAAAPTRPLTEKQAEAQGDFRSGPECTAVSWSLEGT